MYIVMSLAVLTAGFFLFRKAAGDMSIFRLNIVSWIFYFQLVLQSFIGANLALCGVKQYMISRASHHAISMAYWAVCYVLVIMPLFMWIFQELLFGGRIREKVRNFFSHPMTERYGVNTRFEVRYWIALTILAFIAVVYTYAIIKHPPIIALLTGEGTQRFNELRVAAKYGFAGNEYVRNLFALFLAPFVSYVAYAYYHLKKTKGYLLWFAFSFIVAVAAVLYDGEKAPIIQYLLTLFFIRTFISGRSKKRWLLGALSLSLVLIILFYSVIGGGLDLAVNSGPLGRLLMTQVMGLPLVFDVFPHMHPFLMGASFPEWFCKLFGLHHLRSAEVLMSIYHPRQVREGVAGVMNTLFIGEAWANFGWIGFITGPIIVGFIIQCIHNSLVSKPKAPVFVAAMGYFMFGLPVTGGFVDFIWSPTWYFLGLLVFLPQVVARQNRKFATQGELSESQS